MEKVEKKNSLSFFSINKLSRKSKALLHTEKQLNKNFAHKKQLESLDINVNSTGTQVLPSNNSNLQQVTRQNNNLKEFTRSFHLEELNLRLNHDLIKINHKNY
jgi:hypothetical protein